METMTTLTEIIAMLKAEGYTEDFNLKASCLQGVSSRVALLPHEFEVDRHYRFEGLSDPADEAVVYAISSASHRLKGTLVNGYGMYTDAATDQMLAALHAKIA